MPFRQTEECNCGATIEFNFRSEVEIVTCSHCKKIWAVDVWGGKSEATSHHFEMIKRLSRSKDPLNIERIQRI